MKRLIDAFENNGSVEFPLKTANEEYIFTTDIRRAKLNERLKFRTSSRVEESSNVEEKYPELFEFEDRSIRYAFQPAKLRARGLIVQFHGWNAFSASSLNEPLKHFDLLCPWDTFGMRRMGSWFWGEDGKDFVAKIIRQLIKETLNHRDYDDWFTFGGSMGGFGALYHGIKYGARGMYTVAPQVDIKHLIVNHAGGINDSSNPYTHLIDDDIDQAPDIISLVEERDEPPPLYLIQRQYDHVNLFKEHAYKLIKLYTEKNGWYGLRIIPAVGHGGFQNIHEAAYFFTLILDKSPRNKVNLDELS